MFPLKNRQKVGYNFGAKPWYGSRHLGQDYRANYEPLFAPFNGVIVKAFYGAQGGYTIHFKLDEPIVIGGKMIIGLRFMHLSKFIIRSGHVNAGQQIAITGNTGLSTGAHLHIDATTTFDGTFWKDFNNFADPEAINWADTIKAPVDEKLITKPVAYPKVVVVAVNKVYVRSAPRTSAPLSGSRYLLKGTKITVTGVVTGQNVSGNDRWYVSIKGNYIWSGAFY